jgi:nitronate monooxygenase
VRIPPIVLAPLAGGPSTPQLAAEVSNAGGLGFLGGGYLAPDELAARLRRTRELTSQAFGVNLFVLREHPVDDAAVAAYARRLADEGHEVGQPRFDDDAFAEKLELAREAEVVSFTFGCPDAGVVASVHETGADVWVTATTVDEATAAVAAGADAVVLQGMEAGGHRGSWDDADDADVPLLELVAAVRREVAAPLVASGGIGTRDDVEAALAAGAAAVQVGTAFLLCPEAGTSEPHRRALAGGGETAITRAFTGRRARGLVNRFMREHADAPRAYPHVHHLTAPLRARARAAGDAELINLWAGTRVAEARAEPAADVVARLSPLPRPTAS